MLFLALVWNTQSLQNIYIHQEGAKLNQTNPHQHFVSFAPILHTEQIVLVIVLGTEIHLQLSFLFPVTRLFIL